MHLIIQYYNDKNPERQKEYDFCLEKNLNNPAIKKIHNIIETETIVPEKFKNHKKLLTIPIDYAKASSNIAGRLTFKYVFDYARNNIPENEVVGTLNLDIFLGHSKDWCDVKKDFFAKNNKNVLCLSRHEYYWNALYKMEKVQWGGASADAWIFLNPLHIIKDCKFTVGNAPGCDGAIGRRFYNAGYNVFNWATKYKIFHVDICRGHSNGIMICTDKTDPEGMLACKRGGLEVPPNQDWDNILKNKQEIIYLYVGGNDIDPRLRARRRNNVYPTLRSPLKHRMTDIIKIKRIKK